MFSCICSWLIYKPCGHGEELGADKWEETPITPMLLTLVPLGFVWDSEVCVLKEFLISIHIVEVISGGVPPDITMLDPHSVFLC